MKTPHATHPETSLNLGSKLGSKWRLRWVLRWLGMVLVVLSTARAENWLPFTLRAPAGWAGESLGIFTDDSPNESYLGTFELIDSAAVLPGSLMLDADDLDFQAELSAGSEFTILDYTLIPGRAHQWRHVGSEFRAATGHCPDVADDYADVPRRPCFCPRAADCAGCGPVVSAFHRPDWRE